MNAIFRPFLWQAHNAHALSAALESTFLVAPFVLRWPRIVGSVRPTLQTVRAAVHHYTTLFAYGFCTFANAGILVRQPLQVLPFALVLVCLPAFKPREQRWRELIEPLTTVHRALVLAGR